MNIPSGIVTFLFTDIEGSSRLAQKNSNAYTAALRMHNEIFYSLIENYDGYIFKIIGDGFCCSFENPEDAVNAAVRIQSKLNTIECNGEEIKVRMGIHSGKAEWADADYLGYITLARTQRIMSSAHGGQIIISEDSVKGLNKENYSENRFRDLGERRLKDMIQPIRLYQVLEDGLPQEFPPIKTLDIRPNNLPIQLSSFIGREQELSDVKKILSDSRLLTLTGPGGTGKTRLSLQAGAELSDEFEYGVWFVDLASLTDTNLLLQTISKVLGIDEVPSKMPEDSLKDFIREKEMLIILDNCEHIIEACSKFAEMILSISPNVKILATSREAMRISSERTYLLLSLKHPDIKDDISPEKMIGYEAIRLFTERALSVDQGFRITNDNAKALSNICFQLDGIPLAIELAAARIKLMSVQKINERLEDRFKLLTGGVRSALPRQQTLKAMVDWSYDMLTDNEKVLLNKLSVFTGGCTLEAAEFICSDNSVSEEDIPELLNGLLEKSLIIYDKENERFRMLETIRQYSKEKFKLNPESVNFELRYLEFFANFSEEMESELTGKLQNECIVKLENEIANFNEALAISVKNKLNEFGLRIAASLGDFWVMHGHFTLGRLWYSRVLEEQPLINSVLTGKAMNNAAKLARLQGDMESAAILLEKSLGILQFLKDKVGIALALKELGSIEFYKGDLVKAQKLYEESLLIYRESDDKPGISTCLNNLGNVNTIKGDLDKAERFFEESLLIKRETGNERAVANALVNLGITFSQKHEYDKAKLYFEEGLMFHRKHGDKSGTITCLINLSNVARYEEDYARSKILTEEGLRLSRELGEKLRISQSLLHMGKLYEAENDNENAYKYFKESLDISREIGNKHETAICLNTFGSFLKDKSEMESAKQYFEESLGLFREIGDRSSELIALLNMGSLEVDSGNYESAKEYFSRALKLLQTETDLKILSEDILELIMKLKNEKNDKDLAKLIDSIDSSVGYIKSQRGM